MNPQCQVAFKEWAVICQALASGQQTIILRKGGIHEGREGFRVQHHQFWLFPTYLHQDDRDKLDPKVWPLLDELSENRTATETVTLSCFAEVTDVIEIAEESHLARLTGWHGWSDQTIHDRYHYRQPGLFLLVVKISQAPTPIEIINSPHFAGCRSWVDLSDPIPTKELTPVLTDAEFRDQRAKLLQLLNVG